MRLGIFAKTFRRSTLAQTLDAVVDRGFDCIRPTFSAWAASHAGKGISLENVTQISHEIQQHKLNVAAVSGTFNMTHPDAAQRQDGLQRLSAMAAVCGILKTSTITLCTGSRDAENMWRRHPDNDSPEAWRDLIASLSTALKMTEGSGVTLGIEPETANVIDSAVKARKLLDEMKSPRLKIILDAANLFRPGDETRMKDIITEAIDLLGGEIIAAHAKDFVSKGGAIEHVAAGRGVLDYDHYLGKLREAGFSGPLVLHGLEEAEVDGARLFLERALAESGPTHVL